jgi:hypothetical protein
MELRFINITGIRHFDNPSDTITIKQHFFMVTSGFYMFHDEPSIFPWFGLPQVLRHQDLRQRAHRRGGEPASIPRGATEGADLRSGEVAWQMVWQWQW